MATHTHTHTHNLIGISCNQFYTKLILRSKSRSFSAQVKFHLNFSEIKEGTENILLVMEVLFCKPTTVKKKLKPDKTQIANEELTYCVLIIRINLVNYIYITELIFS